MFAISNPNCVVLQWVYFCRRRYRSPQGFSPLVCLCCLCGNLIKRKILILSLGYVFIPHASCSALAECAIFVTKKQHSSLWKWSYVNRCLHCFYKRSPTFGDLGDYSLHVTQFCSFKLDSNFAVLFLSRLWLSVRLEGTRSVLFLISQCVDVMAKKRPWDKKKKLMEVV